MGKVAVRGDAATAQRLMEAVGDVDPDVRASAARSLSQVAATDAIGQVRDLVTLAAMTGASSAKSPPPARLDNSDDAFATKLPAAPPGQRMRKCPSVQLACLTVAVDVYTCSLVSLPPSPVLTVSLHSCLGRLHVCNHSEATGSSFSFCPCYQEHILRPHHMVRVWAPRV